MNKKNKNNKFTSFVVPFCSFLAVCFLLFIFTFYVDGEMGIILIYFTFSAPVLSVILTLNGRKKVDVTFENDAYVKKGASTDVKISLSKKTLLPIGFVEIYTETAENLSQTVCAYRTSLSSKKKSEIIHTLTAMNGGYSYFKIKEVYVCDYLGFFRFKIKTPLPSASTIGVIPNIPQVSASTQLFKSINNIVVTSDEETEQDTVLAFSANTCPGYEHREYIEGDSLKRVNWKVSSKRHKLMVRLDEAVSSVQPAIVFDLYRGAESSSKDAIIREERLYESVFGLLLLFVNQGIGCNFIYRTADSTINQCSIESEDALNTVLFSILTVPVSVENPIDYSKIDNSGACAVIAAVPYINNRYADVLSSVMNSELNCAVVSDSINNVPVNSLEIWCMDEDNDFKLVK